MKQRTLVSDRRYFGLDALALRAAAGRVAARVAGLAPDRARVRGAFLRQDFGVDTVDGRALLDDLCADGLLARPEGPTSDFLVTPRLVEYAAARVVEPLSRVKAKLLVSRACELAERVNREWGRNPLEIAMIVPYGSYLAREQRMDELPLALVVRSRPVSYRKRELLEPAVLSLAFGRAPALRRAVLGRSRAYQRSLELIAHPPAGITVEQLAPPRPLRSSRTTQDRAALLADYELGVEVARAYLLRGALGA